MAKRGERYVHCYVSHYIEQGNHRPLLHTEQLKTQNTDQSGVNTVTQREFGIFKNAQIQCKFWSLYTHIGFECEMNGLSKQLESYNDVFPTLLQLNSNR